MSTLQDTTLTTDTGRRMISYISPVYSNSYVGLWLTEVIGREYDQMHKIIRTFPQQFSPTTVTWAIELWEQRYGLPSNETLSYAERRRAILERQRNRGPFTPKRVKDLAELITGFSARVDERVAPYTFAVYLLAQSSDDTALRQMLNRIKPAHMSFEIRHEQSAPVLLCFGSAVQQAKRITIRQVN